MGFISQPDQRYIDFFLHRAASKATEEDNTQLPDEEIEKALRELFNINYIALLAVGATIASLEEQDFKAFLRLLERHVETVVTSYQINFLPIYPESKREYHTSTVRSIYRLLLDCVEGNRNFLRDAQNASVE